MKVCVMTQNGLWPWREGEVIFELPTKSQDPRSSTFASMEVTSDNHGSDYTNYAGKMFLVTIDAFLKWLDVQVVNAATSNVTNEPLWTPCQS